MKSENSGKLWKGLLLLAIVGILIGIENVYREPLFEKSLEWIKSFQDGDQRTSTINFFKFMTILGTEAILIPLFVLFFNWGSLGKSYLFLTILILSAFIDAIMKMVYSNPRPFWVNQKIALLSCEGGYGNPSGHAFTSSALYLSIWHLTSQHDFFKSRLWLKITYLIGIVLLFLTIIMSRFYLGVHSFNQLLYGCVLGVALYAFFFLVLEDHALDSKGFWERYSSRNYHIFYWIAYPLMFLLAILLFTLKEYDNGYKSFLEKNCPSIHNYKVFGYEGFYTTLTLFTLIGSHAGLNVLVVMVQKYYPRQEVMEHIFEWTDTTFAKSILRIVFIGALSAPTFIPMMVISSEANLAIIYVFKAAFPFCATLMIDYSLGIFFAYKLGLTKNDFDSVIPDEEKIDVKDGKITPPLEMNGEKIEIKAIEENKAHVDIKII